MLNNKVSSVLVIDDDRDDYDLVAEAVHSIDPTIAVAYLNCCEDREKFEGQHFDMILLDINMPAHDGFSWLQGIRNRGYDFPIVMYTNSNSPAHIVKAYGDGATLFFNKPDNYSQLTKGIQKLLELDWSDPLSITQMHIQDGKYKTFQVA